MTDQFFHTSADTMLRDNLTFLGENQQLENLQKNKFFPRKSPLKFIGNCSDLQSTERGLIGLEEFETAIRANSSPRKKWLCLFLKETYSMGRELGLTPRAVPVQQMERLLKEE